MTRVVHYDSDNDDVDLDMYNPLIARARMCANRAIIPV